MTPLKQVRLPVSKSLCIRKLVYDFLNNGRVGEIPDEAPADVEVVHDALEVIASALKRRSSETEMNANVSFGVESEKSAAEESKLGHTVESEELSKAKPVVIDVHDCGAAYRFLMAVLAVTPGQWLLTGTERLLQRPIEELVEALRSIGAEIQWYSCIDVPWHVYTTNVDEIFCRDAKFCVSTNNGEMVSRGDARPCVSTNAKQGWLIHGKNLHASDLTIDCHRSGQFASALLLIGGKIGLKNLRILPENPSSLSYIEMTKAVVKGSVTLDEKYLADWSAAVYWYAHLLLSRGHKSSVWATESGGVTYTDLSNSVTVPASCGISKDFDAQQSYKLLHLDMNSIQSDAVIACWFADWGIESRQEDDGVIISYKENLIKPQETIELDMSQNLDLVPVLACMACLWPKKMIFNGVANLKFKESDRLQIIQEQLSAFADIELKAYKGVVDNQLVINPRRDEWSCVSATNYDANSGRDSMQCVSINCSNANDLNCPDADFVFDAHNDHRFVMGFSLFALKGMVYIKGFDSVKKSYPDFHAEGVVGGTDIVG